jgi:AcrR family transcriptional regulator
MPPRDRTKRRVEPSQQRAHASIDAILTAAEQLLREQGFARMTTNRIAQRAGVNVSLVYRYFAGKEAIVGALIERFAEQTLDAARTALREHASAPLAIGVRALLSALVTTPSAPELHRELVEHVDISKRRELVRELGDKLSLVMFEFLAQRSAELRVLPDAQATFFVLQHALEAATHAAAFYRPEGLTLERALDALTDLVVRTLSPLEAPPRKASS